MNWLRRFALFVSLFSFVLLVGATIAVGADISEVVDDTASTGFYLDSGVSISDTDATEIVSAARNNGSRFYLVVLNDTPLGGNTAFAEAVFDELNVDAGTIFVLSPEDVGWVSDDEGFSEGDQEAAFEFANEQGGSDAEYAANFVVGLVGEPENGTVIPEPTEVTPTTAVAAASGTESSGGGGNGLLWFVLIVGGIGLLLFFLMRRGSKQTVNAGAEQMAKARGAVQKQVDAVANDILDLEDEVRVASNTEVDEFYNAASETYRGVTERLQKAETPQHLVDISNDLDETIWQLDCAEALLDGKPKPPKPQRKSLERAPTQSSDRVTTPPRTDHQRRPSRKSSYMGPGVMEILIGVAGQVLGGGGGRGRGGGLGGMLRRQTPTRTSTPRARGGGGVVPGPGSPVPRRSTRSTRSSRPSRPTRTRRSGGGRTRGGGKRRK